MLADLEMTSLGMGIIDTRHNTDSSRVGRRMFLLLGREYNPEGQESMWALSKTNGKTCVVLQGPGAR